MAVRKVALRPIPKFKLKSASIESNSGNRAGNVSHRRREAMLLLLNIGSSSLPILHRGDLKRGVPPLARKPPAQHA